MSSRTVLITTQPDGSFELERPLFGEVLGVLVDIGDMTAPDIVITDANWEVDVLIAPGASSGPVQLDPPVFVAGAMRVTVANGGDTKHGSLRFLTRT